MSKSSSPAQQGMAINSAVALINANSVMRCVVRSNLAIAIQEVLRVVPTERQSWFIPLMTSSVSPLRRLQVLRRLEIPLNGPSYRGESLEISLLSDSPTSRDDFAARAFVWEVVLGLVPDHAQLAMEFVNSFLPAEHRMTGACWLAPSVSIPTLPPFWIEDESEEMGSAASDQTGRQIIEDHFESRCQDLSEIESIITDDATIDDPDLERESPPQTSTPVRTTSPLTSSRNSTTPPAMPPKKTAPTSSAAGSNGTKQAAKSKSLEADWVARSQVNGTHSVPQAGKFFFCDLCGCKFSMFKSLSRDWREKHKLSGTILEDKTNDWKINWRDHMFTEIQARAAGRDRKAFK